MVTTTSYNMSNIDYFVNKKSTMNIKKEHFIYKTETHLCTVTFLQETPKCIIHVCDTYKIRISIAVMRRQPFYLLNMSDQKCMFFFF